MDILAQLLTLLGPTLVAIFTVPLMSGIKWVVTFVDKWPPWAQQITTVLIAFGLSQLGALTNLALPTDLHLFADANVSALISSGMAFAIHAGKKAKT